MGMALQRTLYGFICCVVVTSFLDTSAADARTRRRTGPTRRAVPVQQAWLESRSAIVLDTRTGAALFERQPDRHMYPASTTKVLTAIVAIENGDLDDIVTIQQSDTQVQPSIIGLRPGERIGLRDLVYGLMLRSGNDAALAIARHVGGTRARFYEMMNEKARDIGCTDSHFTNPHGLPDRNHYTTARDLGRIMVHAMKNPDFRAVTSTQRHVVKSPMRTRVMINKNRLLRTYPGTTGGKPGYTRAAQQTLVAAAKRRDRELVVVCLHSAGRALWSDATHLFDFGFDRLGLGRTAPDRRLSAAGLPTP
jgi:D-alanyl-D-alanine carboxypeptidase (penicillin-binding protein 5/6)